MRCISAWDGFLVGYWAIASSIAFAEIEQKAIAPTFYLSVWNLRYFKLLLQCTWF